MSWVLTCAPSQHSGSQLIAPIGESSSQQASTNASCKVHIALGPFKTQLKTLQYVMWWWIVLIFIYGLQNCCAYFENGASRIAICSSTSSWRLRAGKRPVPARHFPVATPPSHKINDRIIAERVRLIEPSENPEEGEVMAGIFSVAEALARARQRNLDLVLITEEADPPVCKIVDYGKFQYAIEKKRKMLMKKQQKEEVKEVKLSPEIDDHDYETKVKAAVRFLLDGDKVL